MKAKRILASVLSVALLLQLSPLGVLALDEGLPQTPQVSTVQENLDPAPTEEPTLVEEPALTEEPAPTAEPTPEETAAPTATPTPEPTAEPTATPAPEETAAPDAAETPAPEPSAEPTAAPDPAAEVQAMIDALPDEVTEDNAEAVEQALTDIDDAKLSLTEEELAGLDLTRYDAAANALLALWGEATADAVEMLANYPQPGIDATDGYYQITNEGELRWFAEAVNNGNTSSNAKLMNNITLDKTTQWTPIGTNTNPFTGIFDGDGHTISGLYFNDSSKDNVGLFGCVGKSGTATGTVKDVTLADSYVSGRDSVGGICGMNNSGTVTNCTNKGNVAGRQQTGGICGYSRYAVVGYTVCNATISNCINTGNVTGTSDHTGGICGYNCDSSVQRCQNSGEVSGANNTGGICGYNYHYSSNNTSSSTIQDCDNTGTVTGAENVGGVCGYNRNGTVKNCTSDRTVKGTGSNIGGICGYNESSSDSTTASVQGCCNSGDVIGAGTYTGGVCGFNSSRCTLQECYNTGAVTGTGDNTGGVCGYNFGTVQKSYNTGTVSGTRYTGGVCGYNKGNTLQECYNTGKVTGKNDCTGGVCGYNDGPLQECYNTGEVSGTTDVGGVCGQNNTNGTVNGCYNTGKVTGTSNLVGGVCGQNVSGTVKGCYNTGEVIGNYPVGSVCGWNGGGTVEKCYYLAGTSEKAVGDGSENRTETCESKTKLQFQNGDVAYQLQKDLGGTTQVWGQRIDGTGETDDHPVLNSTSAYMVHKAAENSPCKRYSNTSGQTFNKHEYDDEHDVCIRCGAWQEATLNGDYYEIYNQGQLRWFANQVNNQNRPNINARLMKDITMDGTEWTPIGTDTIPFTGTFEGDGHTISKLTCTDTNKDHVGLVGYAIDATIQNVTVQGATLNGRDHIGAVCGYLTGGTITNCHAVETVIGHKYCGGIVGYIMGNTNVTGCTNSGTVSGYSFLGGIVGQAHRATVQRCFNSGAVTGNRSPIGGIVGQAITTTVQDCGNTGAVTRADNSGDCGGIAGSTNSTSSIKNCYNAYSTITYPICAFTPSDTTLLNCYYLADNPGTDPSAKTEAQFNSGEVAYLLQNGERTDTTTTVWGQTLTGGSQQAFPVLNGDKVYQTTPCTAGYSNTDGTYKAHTPGTDGKCIDCKQLCISYTVTIPATVELGNAASATATISAENVTLPTDKTLQVTVNGPFTATLVGKTDVTAQYTIQKDGTALESGDPVLTANNGESPKIPLTFVKPNTAPYAGSYTGTVTFTVSVGDKTPTT